MSDERRSRDRNPDFRKLKLVTRTGSGEEQGFPVTLRDVSNNGIGAMYVGTGELDPEDDFLLRDADGGDRKVRIVWTKKVADFVLILGMEFVEP